MLIIAKPYRPSLFIDCPCIIVIAYAPEMKNTIFWNGCNNNFDSVSRIKIAFV